MSDYKQQQEPRKPRLDPRLAARLEQKKAQLDSYRPLNPAILERLNQDLRVFLTYHSNAIEGNTLTLQETQIAIEYGLTIHGHPIREVLEATNHAEAYNFVTQLVADPTTPITRSTILSLHALVTDKILPSKGTFRRVPVYIRGSNMTPPPHFQIENLIGEWFAWLKDPGPSYHPVLRAAIAHHGFEAIHPFEDGNGRVGRLLLNLFLMRDGYPPALVLREWRASYIKALNTANTGNYTPLSNLIGRAVDGGFDLYLQACAGEAETQTSSSTNTSEEAGHNIKGLLLLPLSELAQTTTYSVDYLGWLIRKGRLAAQKRNGRWYSSREALEEYKAQGAEKTGIAKRGRPKKMMNDKQG